MKVRIVVGERGSEMNAPCESKIMELLSPLILDSRASSAAASRSVFHTCLRVLSRSLFFLTSEVCECEIVPRRRKQWVPYGRLNNYYRQR